MVAAGVTALAGCGGGAATGGPQSTSPEGTAWERVVYGIEVVDQDGTPFHHPFLGGLNLPRPQLQDVDGDGDMDLFVQELTNEVMLFENVGGESGDGYRWRTDQFESLPVGEWYRFTDVDLDGDLDLLSEHPFSYIRFYRNEGGPGAAARYTLGADTLRDVTGSALFSDRQNIPNATDIDCDGSLDLMIGRLTGTITRYEAEGMDADGVPRFRFVTDNFEDIEIVAAIQGSLHGANTMALGDVDQ
ncbi:MAG: VCBS repeat-containing protein, partial [Gemmatimonadetes bacterium]|nr:VCBS repeat-containing protein [Gemmatimonadota bacterium]